MAMAELVIHEVEDTLPHFPPAPPPSPEAQRARSTNFFDIPTTVAGFGPLDLRRQDFAALDLILSQSQGSLSNSSPLSTVPERGSPYDSSINEEGEEDEYDFPASPKKRLCNSPCSFPEGYDIQSNEFHCGAKFTSSSLPHPKSTRHHRSPVHSANSPPLLSVPNSNGTSFAQTSPHSVPCRPQNGFEIANQPTHSYNPCLSTPIQPGMLSKSFDLHDVTPFQLNSEFGMPEVRSRQRAYTLDATSQGENSSHRARKISLKRTKDERDSDLQFSFEYSYASTGSSEEADWLVVTPDTAAALPLDKKVCQDPPTNASALPLSFANSSYMNPSLASSLPPVHPQPPVTSFFAQPTPSLYNQSPLTEQPPSLVSMESVQFMDTGDTSLRLDSLDSMECGGAEQLPSYTEMDTQYENTQASHPHNLHTTLSPPATLRSHSSEEKYTNTRTNFVQENGAAVQDISTSGFNFSRSL